MARKHRHRAGKHLPEFLAGDIILFSGKSDLYGRFTRWLMRSRGEGPTYAVHVAQFIDSRRVLEMDVVGKIKTVDDILNKRVDLDTWQRRGFEVWRCTSLTPEQREAITRETLRFVNSKFGFAMFTAQLFDGLIRKASNKDVYLFRRLAGHSVRPICSEITSEVYYHALHYQFGVPPECADPDNLYDWVYDHPGEWVRVFDLKEFAPQKPARMEATPAR